MYNISFLKKCSHRKIYLIIRNSLIAQSLCFLYLPSILEGINFADGLHPMQVVLIMATAVVVIIVVSLLAPVPVAFGVVILFLTGQS